MALKQILTQARLKELLNYNPLTGIFTRRIGRQGYRAGTVAGSVNYMGYIVIRADRKRYQAHRLAWLYIYGRFPGNEIDHSDHDRANNKISNLREATRAENCRNINMAKNNASGVTGVSWHKKGNKWNANIQFNNKKIYLGLFSDFAKAAAARKSAELKYGFHPNHGKDVA